MPGRYSSLYRRTREPLEAEAAARLQRPLTRQEQNLFRSCGTLTMLESLGMTVYYAEHADDLAAKLAEISMQSRFQLALKETQEHLVRLLGRELTATEQEYLQNQGNVEALWYIEEHIQEIPLEKREMALLPLLTSESPLKP